MFSVILGSRIDAFDDPGGSGGEGDDLERFSFVVDSILGVIFIVFLCCSVIVFM